MARVAVVIPCFNSGATLPETLASVSSEECEVVVVDDGSDDPDTLAVLRSVEAGGVTVVHQPNQGPASARTTGLRLTAAPYVFPLDADDIVEPDALARLANTLDETPDAAVAWGYVSFPHNSLFRGLGNIDPWLLTYLNPLPYLAMFRRTVLEQHGGWPTTGVHEDWDLWMTLAEHRQDGVRVPIVTSQYRPSPTGRWARGRRHYNERIVQLRGLHPALFARRRANWKTSTAPMRCRLLLPLLSMLPLEESTKRRLYDLVFRPDNVIRAVGYRHLERIARTIRPGRRSNSIT